MASMARVWRSAGIGIDPSSERPEDRTQDDDGGKSDERANDGHHEEILVAVAVVMPQTASRVTTAPLCGRLSRVPALITATRCSSASAMLGREAKIGFAQRIEGNGEAA